jgi:hypothetical protein
MRWFVTVWLALMSSPLQADDEKHLFKSWHDCVIDTAYLYGKETTETVDLVVMGAFGKCKRPLAEFIEASDDAAISEESFERREKYSEDQMRDRAISAAFDGRAAANE